MRTIRSRASLLVLLAVVAFGSPAVAKPSDWASVVEKPGERSTLPSPSKNAAPRIASQAKPTKERGKKAKAKKAPRRAKAKRAHR